MALYVSAELYGRHLNELVEAGFTEGSLPTCAGPRERSQAVITFDDGYVNVLRYGLQPLAAAGFKAIQFLPVNFLGKRNEWDVACGETPEIIMDTAQVRDWLAAGHDIGSHTMSHPFLTRLTPKEAREEIFASRMRLEDLFGRRVEHFCYPYGDWNESVKDLVMQAGYQTACTTDPGVNTATDSAFALKRFTARYESRNLMAIWRRLAGR